MKTQRKVCGFDENDMKTYSCGRGLRQAGCMRFVKKSQKKFELPCMGRTMFIAVRYNLEILKRPTSQIVSSEKFSVSTFLHLKISRNV